MYAAAKAATITPASAGGNTAGSMMVFTKPDSLSFRVGYSTSDARAVRIQGQGRMA